MSYHEYACSEQQHGEEDQAPSCNAWYGNGPRAQDELAKGCHLRTNLVGIGISIWAPELQWDCKITVFV